MYLCVQVHHPLKGIASLLFGTILLFLVVDDFLQVLNVSVFSCGYEYHWQSTFWGARAPYQILQTESETDKRTGSCWLR